MSLAAAQRALPELHQKLAVEPRSAAVLFDANGRYLSHAGCLPFAAGLSVDNAAKGAQLAGLPLGAVAALSPLHAYGRELGWLASVDAEGRSIDLQAAHWRWLTGQIEQWATVDFEIDNLSRELADTYESIHLLCDVSAVWSRADNLDQLGLRMLEMLTAHIQCQAAALLLRDDRADPPVRALATLGGVDAAFWHDAEWARILTEARPEGDVQSWTVDDPHCLEAARRLLREAGWRNALAAPMCVQDQVIGLLVLGDRFDSEPGMTEFDSRDTKLVDALATQAAAMIHGMRTFGLSKEMDIARRIQRQLLPRRLPDLQGWDLAGSCAMAHSIGGDLYWVERLGERRIAAVIADVSGHDLGSALLMASARAQLRILLPQVDGPGQAMERLNRHLYDDLSSAGLFLTLFIVFLDADSGELRYSAGGHNPPLLLRAGDHSCIPLDSPGPPAGLEAALAFREERIWLEPGDLLLMYTDGYTEAVDAADEMFGEERLMHSLRRRSAAGAAEIVAALEDDVAAHRGAVAIKDDGTLLLLKRAPSGAGGMNR